MSERSNENLCPGASPATLRECLTRAIAYWSNNKRALLPELDQVMTLHHEIFHGYFVEGIPGILKQSRNYIQTSLNPPLYLHFTCPDHVAEDYRVLRRQARVLHEQMKLPDVEYPDPSNPRHWPADDDTAAWSARALYIAYFHAHLIYIHPFRDGNGRLARLIAWEQARRLFPAISRADPSPGPNEIDDKTNPFLLLSGAADTAATVADYNTAMQSLKIGALNYHPLMRYFMFQPGMRDKIPYPQGQPEFRPIYSPGYCPRPDRPPSDPHP